MYKIQWDIDTGGILLVDTREELIQGEIRPVFFEELDLLGFDQYWSYPREEKPLLWAIGGRKYYYRGNLVAEAEGGGLFTKPKLNIHQSDLTLVPVHIGEMVSKNSRLMGGLVQRSLRFICQAYDKHRQKVDTVAVAFSGGKDSLVTLDLVQRALEPNQFFVVFGDTGMEISDTYRAVEAAKMRWPHLDFHTAKSAKDALTTWREMGPPSRIHRWCCSVHKSVPTLLLLRQLVGQAAVRALIYDGVRHEESASRATYQEISSGSKHNSQINASPIINWNAGEVYLYLFGRNLLMNRAYRFGVVRVGCAVCPMASQWKDMIDGMVYQKDILEFVQQLRDYASAAGIRSDEVDQYIENGGWKGRAGGRYLPNGGNRVMEQIDGNKVIFILRGSINNWKEWAKTVGRVVWSDSNHGHIERSNTVYPYAIRPFDHSVCIEVDGLANADRYTHSAFRAIALKSTYCTHCQACQIECPIGVLDTMGQVHIGDDCTACGQCLDLHGEACLAAKSMIVSEGGKRVSNSKSLPSYQTFGMQKEWLSDFFDHPMQWLSHNTLGNLQFDAMVMWLRHAELIGGRKNSYNITRLGEKLAKRGTDDLITWAVIWTNLVRNSASVHWYADSIPWGSSITKAECVEMMGDTFSQSERARENATKALFATLTKTPLGSYMGLGQENKTKKRALLKQGWNNPEPIAILYSLYRYAEKEKHYELTVRELYEDATEGPYISFGIERETFIGIVKGLSAMDDGFIHVDIIGDLDNIFLDSTCRAEEVLDLA